MSKEEKGKAENEWHQIKNSLPSGIELVGEYIHAWEPSMICDLAWMT